MRSLPTSTRLPDISESSSERDIWEDLLEGIRLAFFASFFSRLIPAGLFTFFSYFTLISFSALVFTNGRCKEHMIYYLGLDGTSHMPDRAQGAMGNLGVMHFSNRNMTVRSRGFGVDVDVAGSPSEGSGCIETIPFCANRSLVVFHLSPSLLKYTAIINYTKPMLAWRNGDYQPHQIKPAQKAEWTTDFCHEICIAAWNQLVFL